MTNTNHEARERRTTALLAAFRGNRDEFAMLKGVLCMDHGARNPIDQSFLSGVFNQLRIAERMDQMNAEVLAAFVSRSQIASADVVRSTTQTNANPGT